MNSFKRYLGALLVILGAILLICSYFLGWNSYNGVQIGVLPIKFNILYYSTQRRFRQARGN